MTHSDRDGSETRHTGGNGEDCPICKNENLVYPFLCRGKEAPAKWGCDPYVNRDGVTVCIDEAHESAGPWVDGVGCPAGPPLHEPTDRDADNVPSDRVRAYAEAIASVMGVQTRYLDPRLARAVMAVADREQAELLAEIARLRGEIDAWKTVVENDTSIQGAMRRTISRVASVCDDWQSGHEPVHHRGYIADLERALRGPEPTEEPR